MVVFGFIANRLNVSITGLEAGSGTHYIPSGGSGGDAVDHGAGFAIFRVVAQYFPVFEEHRRAAASAAVCESAGRLPAGVGETMKLPNRLRVWDWPPSSRIA